MKLSAPESKSKSGEPRSNLDAPARPELRWIRLCLVLILVSGALLVEMPGETASFGPVPGLVFIGILLAAGAGATLIGLRHLLVRPGAFLVFLAFGSIAVLGAVELLRGQSLTDVLRTISMPLLFAVTITTTHVAACAGMRAGELVRLLLVAIGAGLLWQVGSSLFAGEGIGLLIARNFPTTAGAFLLAWALCLVVLRPAPSRISLAVTALLLAIGALALSTPHGVPLPLLLLPAIGATAALALGTRWRFFSGGKSWQKFAPAVAFLALGVAQLFTGNHALERPAIGATSELLAAAAILLILIATASLSLRSARRNTETVMGRWASDAPLMFLPFVAALTLLGSSLTGTPFSEPFGVVLLGALAAMPQCFFNRAYYLRHRENEAAISPQLILSEEDLPTTWQDAFPSNA